MNWCRWFDLICFALGTIFGFTMCALYALSIKDEEEEE